MYKLISVSVLTLFGLSIVCMLYASPEEFEKNEYRQELYLSDQGISRDASQVSEQKQYEYETQKTITDMQGYRVRMEQYLSRTKTNELRVDVYNSRDNRTDTAYRIDTFNIDLPIDLSEVVYQTKTNPTWFITDRFTHAENDSGNYFEHILSGGKLYQTALDYYQVLYDEDKTIIDGKAKIDILRKGHDATQNITGYNEFYYPNAEGNLELCFDSRFQFNHPLLTWEYMYNVYILPVYENTPTWRDVVTKLIAGEPIDLHRTTKLGFADGTSLTLEHAWIDDNGKIINTNDLKQAREDKQADRWDTFSQWNIENIVTASEWGGKNIDIIWSPQNFLAQIVSKKEEE